MYIVRSRRKWLTVCVLEYCQDIRQVAPDTCQEMTRRGNIAVCLRTRNRVVILNLSYCSSEEKIKKKGNYHCCSYLFKQISQSHFSNVTLNRVNIYLRIYQFYMELCLKWHAWNTSHVSFDKLRIREIYHKIFIEIFVNELSIYIYLSRKYVIISGDYQIDIPQCTSCESELNIFTYFDYIRDRVILPLEITGIYRVERNAKLKRNTRSVFNLSVYRESSLMEKISEDRE